MQATYGIEFLYATCLGCTKISLVITMMRVFFVRKFQIAAWAVITMCFMWMLFTILIGLFICWPVPMNWNANTEGGRCGDQMTAFAAVGVVDLVTDLAIIILPVPMSLSLQLKWRHKMALLVVFGAGIL